jgi:hypothetical protein
MGMSDDFELAVKFGATHVRVGTAIFGAGVNETPHPNVITRERRSEVRVIQFQKKIGSPAFAGDDVRGY